MMRTTTAAPLTRIWQVLAATLVVAGLMLAAQPAEAQDPSNGLRDIQVQALPNRGVELRLVMSEAAPEPISFTIDNPARIVLDIPESKLQVGTRRQQVDLGPLDTIMMAEANGRTRAVLN
ncbi:MAG: AMIN domain-containing protein, partial [Pseudomonadota bacterium]